ncbi:MAG: carbon-phosphorus lyase complex subunit PhnI [Chloroflexota bacterium]|nr:carbon-phosphorus lyase complex subunit PhnI [Chloroflexota bacterium]
MGYKPVKGGAAAIRAAAQLTGWLDLDDREVAIEVEQIRHQLGGAVERVMSEGGLYAPDLAALAIKQAEGDLSEAALLLRAYRSTLPRQGYALATSGRAMRVQRRISSAFKDVPGGQVLGRTRDYTHRLLDFSLLEHVGRVEHVGQGQRIGRDNGVATGNGHTGNGHTGNGHTENGHTGNGHLETGGPGPDADTQIAGWPAFPKVSDTLRGMGLMTPVSMDSRDSREDSGDSTAGDGAPEDSTAGDGCGGGKLQREA